MRVTMVGGGIGSLLWTTVIIRCCGSDSLGRIMTVLADMEMLLGFVLRKVINRVANRRYASVSGIERKDERQKEGENGSHLLVILSH